MIRYLAIALVLSASFLGAPNAHANLWEKLGLKRNSGSSSAIDLSKLSEDQVVTGLKQALSQGITEAVQTLGRTNGFLTNLSVRIPVPEQLQTIEKTLRTLKQDKVADEFLVTMNRAAEQAVPVAYDVFADALKQMTITDAKTLLAGGSDSATQYFRRLTETNLTAKFLPIVQKATAANNVTGSYKKLVERTGSGGSSSGSASNSLSGLLGRSAEQYLSKTSVDIDLYVTQKALDGLFTMVAAEEKLIRENPKARTTELMEKVFGAMKR